MGKCFFGHKWEESLSEDMRVDENIRRCPDRTRICMKCHKKQRWSVTPDFGSGWYEAELTPEDIRHLISRN